MGNAMGDLESGWTRRDFCKTSLGLAGAGLGAAFFGPWKFNHVYASAQDKPITIGITTDTTGQYGSSGASELLGIRMAISECNERGGLLGRKIQWIHQDTETNPATGSRVAEKMISRYACNFLVGGVSSGVSDAIARVAQKHGAIYMDTNSSSPSESGAHCHRVKFVWDGNGNNFGRAIVKNAIQSVGKKWVLLTSDYEWGRQIHGAVRIAAEAGGAQIVKELMVPEGTVDFTSYLEEIKRLKPDVVGAAFCGDYLKALRAQASHAGLREKPAWIFNQQDWPDIYGLPKGSLFGTFATCWYHKFDLPGVADFIRKYRAAYPQERIPVPGNVFYNGYMATRELLRAVERRGTVNNIAVIKELEGLRVTARDRMQHHDAYMSPITHQLQQSVYVATENLDRRDDDDVFKILSRVDPEEVADDAAGGACKMDTYEATPTYEG
jgi:branched-chain amino acid transport system substrate-binding protein